MLNKGLQFNPTSCYLSYKYNW